MTRDVYSGDHDLSGAKLPAPNVVDGIWTVRADADAGILVQVAGALRLLDRIPAGLVLATLGDETVVITVEVRAVGEAMGDAVSRKLERLPLVRSVAWQVVR